MKSHVQFGSGWSLSKVLYLHDARQVCAEEKLKEWLAAHYAVTDIDMVPHGAQAQLRITFKSVTSPTKQLMRAHAIDGFIGGWLAAQEFRLNIQGVN